MKQSLRLYSVFHLNLAYSSIEEESRPEVIRRCYWPILRLAEEFKIPFGVEASGFTLETIAGLDSDWISELKSLCAGGLVEFIGSGYAQIVGPLVPAEVNAANLRIGHEVHERLLGFKPKIALVNEQAYAPGLVPIYLDAGYEAIVMEWDNPAHHHPEWDANWRYLPQRVCAPDGLPCGAEMPIIWSKSIAFQKFQRYAHGELEKGEYLDYLAGHASGLPRAFPLYSNDAEIFDFRPGRYLTEAAISKEGEWNRLRALFKSLKDDKRFEFVRPSQVLRFLNETGAGNRLHLESAAAPIPVKKQGKYNITRWAVTGPDDLVVNTICWRIYQALVLKGRVSEENWKELCYLWGSDFRTHITEKRWKKYCLRLSAFEHQIVRAVDSMPAEKKSAKAVKPVRKNQPFVERKGRFLIVETRTLRASFNCQKGLAIDGVWPIGTRPAKRSDPPLIGTLAHGYYDDISLGADWYTGHVVLEIPGKSKVTDLSPVEPTVEIEAETGDALVQAVVATRLGPMTKTVRISASEPALGMDYQFDWKEIPVGSFHIGNITLHPESFDRASLRYRCQNGGNDSESFSLAGKTIEHGAWVSPLVSAQDGLGMTGSWVEVGDANHAVRVEVDKASAALIGLMSYQEIARVSTTFEGGAYFCRLTLSAGEMDESRRIAGPADFALRCRMTLKFITVPSKIRRRRGKRMVTA